MRGNGVISVTGKEEIQTSLALLTTAATVTRSFCWLFPKLSPGGRGRGGAVVSSNTLRDGAGEQDKGSGAAGVKRLLGFWIDVLWPRAAEGRLEAAGQSGSRRPSPPDGTRQHRYSSLCSPPPLPPPTSARRPSAPRSRNANTEPPIQMIQYYLNPARESVLGPRGERRVIWRRPETCVRFH